jgi:hypothetical protein
MKRLSQLLVLLICFNAYAAQDQGLLWRAQSATATVYLLGSIHYADDGFYPLRRQIEQAFDQADRLVVEVNMDAAGVDRVKQLIEKQGSYQGSDTIRNHIHADTHANLLKQLQQLNIPYALVAQQKPGILIMTLTSAQLMRQGFNPEQGIDAHFLRRAQAQKKPVLELETIEQQLNLLLNIADGDLLLQETLSESEQMEETMSSLVRDWKKGDEKRLNTLLFDDVLAQYPAYLSIYEQLFFRRNLAMAEKIEHYLQTDHSYFVIIGAGHLLGDKGVVALLNNKGHKVVRF